MRKSFLYILCFVVVCQLIGCGGGEEQRRQLAELEEQNHSGQHRGHHQQGKQSVLSHCR